ncbi:hypothetical protein [Candidatus Frankia alpina]|uniref:hypothetical protein n=1 Tax=Candidatus Frankia alpina TaxID=2699483 RepID=UPI0013871083|nr:hypothetical protein [Candidatus Frankia alpina]
MCCFDEGPYVSTDTGSYADRLAATRQNTTVQYEHRFGSVISAIAGAGLRIEFLHERDIARYAQFDSLVRGPDGFRLPEGHQRVPLMYSLRAAKPDRPDACCGFADIMITKVGVGDVVRYETHGSRAQTVQNAPQSAAVGARRRGTP